MMTARKEFDHGLEDLRELLLDMGRKAATALDRSLRALSQLDVEGAKRVIENDVDLNRLDERVFDLGARLIATQQPVAKDLRRILIAFKISNDLERMGDLSVDVAKVVLRLSGEKLIKPLIDIPRMGEIVQTMIDDAIRAFVTENVDLAYKMAKDDDRVDELYGQILRELFALMAENPATIAQASQLSFVGRFVERIGDYATNIGENVVYLVTGTRPELNA